MLCIFMKNRLAIYFLVVCGITIVVSCIGWEPLFWCEELWESEQGIEKVYFLSIAFFLNLICIVTLIEAFRHIYWDDLESLYEFSSFFVISLLSGAIGIPTAIYQITNWPNNA